MDFFFFLREVLGLQKNSTENTESSHTISPQFPLLLTSFVSVVLLKLMNQY